MRIAIIAVAMFAAPAAAQQYQPVPNLLQQQQEQISAGLYQITPQQQQQIMQQQGGGIYNPNDPRNQIPQGGIVPQRCVGAYCVR